ncbi:type II toxin-antitoxin system VapC family toxin [Candidatus Saccharibacteria bacterium]|nr:type II toxin-antitoxin system VapC family toxin [Candidatus Saccharibacteria bacterium]
MIALDANIFIYWLDNNPEFSDQATAILYRAEQGEITVCASEMVVMEVLSSPLLSDTDAEAGHAKLMALGVCFESMSRSVLLKAAKIRRTYKLGAMDSMHVASAMLAGCTHFVTNDRQVLSKRVPGIEIVPLAGASKYFTEVL